MYTYSIMPLFTDHVEEICEDIRKQYETGVATDALFVMTLVPEGNPPVDKAGILAEKFDIFQDRLRKMGLECGILVQASIGHGYPLNSMFPFQRYVNLNNGMEENIVCPYDEDFRAHFKNVMRTLASHHPKQIMVDDDFRLMFRDGHGCACPKHMAAFNKKAGTNMTREELYAHTQGTSEEDRYYTRIFIETQRESLLGAAKAMREGMDEVDPRLPGVFCACGDGAEFASEIARILAGKGNPVIVRLNNGRYTAPGARDLTSSMYRAAAQVAALGPGIDAVLAETDTCPQNRYSTGFMALHAHYTGSILEGARGAKHWITRLRSFEPESGQAYRKKLAQCSGFYSRLADWVPRLTWLGCRIPLSSVPCYGFAGAPALAETDGWYRCVLERLGLPMYFSANEGGAVFLDGPADERFTDSEILRMLSGPVFLAADTAARLIQRGFGPYLGVDVRPWTGRHASGETLYINGNSVNAQNHICELVPQNDQVRADSMVFHIPDGKTQDPLFPGTTVFDNSLGGRVHVFSGTPKGAYNHIEAFSFLNESRKKQMIRMLEEAGCLPVYYPGDTEVYLRAAACDDGRMFCSFFNLGLDPLDQIQLNTGRAVRRITYLNHDGEETPCAFLRNGDTLTLDLPAYTLDPVILFLD